MSNPMREGNSLFVWNQDEQFSEVRKVALIIVLLHCLGLVLKMSNANVCMSSLNGQIRVIELSDL